MKQSSRLSLRKTSKPPVQSSGNAERLQMDNHSPHMQFSATMLMTIRLLGAAALALSRFDSLLIPIEFA